MQLLVQSYPKLLCGKPYHAVAAKHAALSLLVQLATPGQAAAIAMASNTDVPSVVPAANTEPANTGRGAEPSSSDSESASRVIYIGQLPHGFYEEQLKGAANLTKLLPFAGAQFKVFVAFERRAGCNTQQ